MLSKVIDTIGVSIPTSNKNISGTIPIFEKQIKRIKKNQKNRKTDKSSIFATSSTLLIQKNSEVFNTSALSSNRLGTVPIAQINDIVLALAVTSPIILIAIFFIRYLN
jgi:uncharacterized membrane protein YdbT with pleckstrin-like domain